MLVVGVHLVYDYRADQIATAYHLLEGVNPVRKCAGHALATPLRKCPKC